MARGGEEYYPGMDVPDLIHSTTAEDVAQTLDPPGQRNRTIKVVIYNNKEPIPVMAELKVRRTSTPQSINLKTVKCIAKRYIQRPYSYLFRTTDDIVGDVNIEVWDDRQFVPMRNDRIICYVTSREENEEADRATTSMSMRYQTNLALYMSEIEYITREETQVDTTTINTATISQEAAVDIRRSPVINSDEGNTIANAIANTQHEARHTPTSPARQRHIERLDTPFHEPGKRSYVDVPPFGIVLVSDNGEGKRRFCQGYLTGGEEMRNVPTLGWVTVYQQKYVTNHGIILFDIFDTSESQMDKLYTKQGQSVLFLVEKDHKEFDWREELERVCENTPVLLCRVHAEDHFTFHVEENNTFAIEMRACQQSFDKILYWLARHHTGIRDLKFLRTTGPTADPTLKVTARTTNMIRGVITGCPGTNFHYDPFGENVLDKYSKLVHNLPQSLQNAETLAAIIMTKGTTTTIISLATGNKRFKSNTRASAGNGLTDCNAEALARRGLVYFLYNQLMAAHETAINTPEESVLMASDAGRYKLKADVRLYLWMCGGGHFVRPFIFNPQGGGEGAQVVEGMAHDGGSGSTAGGHVTSGSATGGGPVLGDNVDKPRSGAMSCNVKVAKWNVVGLQGALLSLYLDPIYISGLIVDSVNNFEQVRLYDRLSSLIASLPAQYQLNNPPITYAAVGLARHENQDYAHIWVIGEAEMEVISCKRGLTHTDARSSKLSKRALFVKFTNLWKKTPPPDLTTPGHVEGAVLPGGSSAPPLPPHLYRCAKMLSENYQAAKKATLSAFVATGLGPWPHQPIYDEFHL